MIAMWHCVVLLSVVCVPVGGTYEQDKLISALLIDADGVKIMKHRLSVENVRRMFAVERDLLKLMKDIPDFESRAFGGASPGKNDLEGLAKVYEEIPEIAHILERQRISAREYLFTKMAAMSAERMAEIYTDEDFRRMEHDEIGKELVMIPAFQFWRKMDPDLKAEAAEWKKIREEMARH